MKKLWKERRFCEHLVRYRMDVISDEVQKLNQKVDTGIYKLDHLYICMRDVFRVQANVQGLEMHSIC